MDEKQGDVQERRRLVFVATECENQQQATKALSHVTKHLEDLGLLSERVQVLSSVPDLEDTITPTQYMIRLFRKQGRGANERQMVLSSEEQMLSVQLCLAELHKEKYGEFNVEASQVIEFNTKIIQEKLSRDNCASDQNKDYTELKKSYNNWLRYCNCVDQADVFSSLKKEDFALDKEAILFLGSPSNKVEQSLSTALVDGNPVSCLHFGLDEEETITMETGEKWKPAVTANARTPSKSSITEAHIESVLMSYLHLLVNSRSELALARVITGPLLDHVAFTHVRRAAKQRNMPMYQTILSFVMRLRLGGRSYQASADCPLVQHTKPLADFTDLMHKLTTVLEEEDHKAAAARLAAKRVVNVVKGALLKNGGGVRRESITAVIERVLHSLTELNVDTMDPKATSSGHSLVGRQTLRVLRQIIDEFAGHHSALHSIHVLSDCFSSQSTPVRIPSLVSQFRSPCDEPAGPSSPQCQPLSARLNINNTTRTPVAPKRYKSAMDWAMPLHDVGINQSPVLPAQEAVKTVVLIHPPSQDPEPLPIAPAAKRTLDTALSAPAKKAKKAPTARAKTTKKRDTLQKGQKQLTAFFRV